MSHPETATPQPEKAPLWKRSLPILIALVIVIVIFGWVLPQFIDYEAVFRAIGAIDVWEWVVLGVAAALRFFPEGWVFSAAQPGLTQKQGASLFLVANALSNVPPGGLDLISRYQMTRSWGFKPSESTSATTGSWIFATFGKLVLPVLAVVFLSISRIQSDEVDQSAIIGLVVVVVGAILLYLVLKSPELAERAGSMLGRFVRWVAGWFRKDVKTDFGTLALEFREQSADLLRKRWHVGLAAGLSSQLALFSVLLLALRFVGLGSDQLDWTVAFAAFSLVAIVTTIPIFNMPGISEAILIGTMQSATGAESADLVAAAVFVYRLLTWLAPIPIGGIAFSRWRAQVEASGRQDILDDFTDDEEPGPEDHNSAL